MQAYQVCSMHFFSFAGGAIQPIFILLFGDSFVILFIQINLTMSKIPI